MINIFISLLTFVLIIISLFMVLVILMQRANANSGMGSAFGGGVTESAFGADTTNILVKATKWASVLFFGIALVLYLLYMSKDAQSSRPVQDDLPEIPVAEQAPAPAATDASADEAGDAAYPLVEALTDDTGASADELPAAEAPAETPDP